jgi:hypothetical protein
MREERYPRRVIERREDAKDTVADDQAAPAGF